MKTIVETGNYAPIFGKVQFTVVKSKLSIPEEYQPLVAVALGYVDGEFSERTKEMNNIKYI